MPDNKMHKNYFEQKLHYLKKVRELLRKEEEAILSANLEGINKAIKRIEDLQVRIDKLDRKYKELKIIFDDRESSRLKELLSDILILSKTNGELLSKLKESIFEEIKTTQLKKNARNVYGDLTPSIATTRSVG